MTHDKLHNLSLEVGFMTGYRVNAMGDRFPFIEAIGSDLTASLLKFADAVREETIRECIATCESERAFWETQSLAGWCCYNGETAGAMACAKKLHNLLEKGETK